MKKTEILLTILGVLSIIGNLIPFPGSSILVVFTLFLLSQLYFWFGFALLNNIRLRHIFKKESYSEISWKRLVGTTGTGIALSMALLGVLFYNMRYPGTYVMLVFGYTTTFIIIIISSAKHSKNKSPFYKNIIVRCSVLFFACFTFYTSPHDMLLNIKYRNHPAYLEAYKNVRKHPDNDYLQQKMEEERLKMEGDTLSY